MQVYKHPDHENVIILSVKTSPIIQQLITSWDHAAELQYDTQQEWYSMSHDTYQKLRRHLMNSATLTPPVSNVPPRFQKLLHCHLLPNGIAHCKHKRTHKHPLKSDTHKQKQKNMNVWCWPERVHRAPSYFHFRLQWRRSWQHNHPVN